MSDLVQLQVVMVPLSKALGLSLVVERAIEAAKNVLEPLIPPVSAQAMPDLDTARAAIVHAATVARTDAANQEADAAAAQQAGERKRQLAQLAALQTRIDAGTDATERSVLVRQATDLRKALAQHERRGEWDESVPVRCVLVEEASDPDDGNTVRALALQLVGLATGIVAASYADIGLFGAFLPDVFGVREVHWVDHVLTGLFIGGGSGPVHTLIDFVTARKTTTQPEPLEVAEAPETKAPAPAAPAVIVSASANGTSESWIDIPYEGGVDVSLLENVHRRAAKPDLIVYHHTAMSSDSTFDDVVRVIKSRTDDQGNHWLTGYNCVIMADGSIHAFCRWDRYGSHAVGYNARSLGISFNGNFETDPRVPYSNADGRYGVPRPTEAQLNAGARVVALWTLLYEIKPDFKDSIIPHKQIASKACPGSQFPYTNFQGLVEQYLSNWAASKPAQERIAAFRLKPYLGLMGVSP
jgi:hypothetical protein